jgi:DNA repair protein RecO (recombination protein O)
MYISDLGIVLSVDKLQEDALIVNIFSQKYGLCSGVVRGIKNKHIYIAGNLIKFEKKARLSDHIGSIKSEIVKAFGSMVIHDKLKLYALNSIVNLIRLAIKPSQEYSELFLSLLEYISNKFDLYDYIIMELNILREMGYGLTLDSCVVTGSRDDLIYVSPKSGHAVSATSGERYKNLMLRLPEFLKLGAFPIHLQEIEDAFNLTGYFLKRYIVNDNMVLFHRELLKAEFLKILA